MVSLKKPAKCISVNNRATAMYVLARTDAFTTGSGLLSEPVCNPSVITIPLEGKTCIHLGWIHGKNGKLSAQTEGFIHLLEKAVSDSIAFTTAFQQAALADRT